MHHFDIRNWTRLGYLVLLVALAITWAGCAPTAPIAVCGNGDVEAGEECDPPNDTTCDIDCTIIEDTEPVCGDAVVDPGEDCDPPDGETCDANCQTIDVVLPVCGDSVIDPGEQCDPPDDIICDQACQIIRVPVECGNSVIEEGERCDPPDGILCDDNCQTISTGGSICGNNIVDPGEQCDPPDGDTCDQACQIIRVPVECGNSVIEEGERCDPPDGILCDDNCQTISAGGSDCGNGNVEPGEQCDPPDGDTCDANCQTTTGGGLANDSCASPTAITEGSHSFTNVGATTDGPQVCAPFRYPQIDSDIWYCFTAPCTEAVTFSLCGSQYDTKMAVYLGCDCPDSDDFWLGCSDDDCGAGAESRTTLPGSAGQEYLIRIGGFHACDGLTDERIIEPLAGGDGIASTEALGDDVQEIAVGAPAGAGEVIISAGANGIINTVEDGDDALRGPGDICDDDRDCPGGACTNNFQGTGTLTIFCESDPDHGLATCAPGAGDCFTNNGTPGCSDVALCETTCASDTSCCDRLWDDLCATKADGIVNGFDVCGPGNGSCNEDEGTPGCDDADCCQTVCEADPFCCLTNWDQVCADSVPDACGALLVCAGARGTCFAEHDDSPGCNIESCCLAVCDFDPVCCTAGWDEVCVEGAESCEQ